MITSELTNVRINDFFNVNAEKNAVLTLKQPKENILILDKGLYNTAICESNISKIDGDLGKLYYRGIPIENLVDNYLFEDIAGKLIFDHNTEVNQDFKKGVQTFFFLPNELKRTLDAIPDEIHPMNFLAIGVNSLSAIEPIYLKGVKNFSKQAQFLIAQVMIIASYYYVKKNKQTWKTDKIQNTLSEQMIYQISTTANTNDQKLAEILNKLLILHAEHEQNCSTFTVRTVASSGADVYTAISAGIAAFKGKLHGGASQYVFEMYEELINSKIDVQEYIKDKIIKKQRIMGLGHRVYNCWDPRAKIMCDMLNSSNIDFTKILSYKNLANAIIKQVNENDFFVKRNICPNPDLLNCIFYNFIGVPPSMNTVMLSTSRIAGWLAHYYESMKENMPLIRPRQIPKN